MPNRVSYTFVVSDKFSRAAKAIANRTKGIRNQMSRLGPAATKARAVVNRAFSGMKKAAVGLQTSMAPMIAGLAGVAVLIKGFTVGADFQESIADLGAITGATGKDLEFLRQKALKLGEDSTLGAAKTAEAFQLVASAKPELLKDGEALAAVTEQVLLLSNAAGLDLAEATSVAAESMNQFGVGADQAARFVNVLAAGSKLGSALVGDVGTAMINVGPVAKAAGLSFEQTNAALQLLAEGGIKGGRAGNQLKGVLLSLEASANKKLRPSLVGVDQALLNLQKLELDNVQNTKLFGRENIAAALALTERAARMRTLTADLTGTNIAQEQANIRLGTVNARMRKLSATIGTKAIAVFDRLTPKIEEMATQFGQFLDGITEDDLAGFADGLSAVLDVVVALSKAAAAVSKLLGPVISAGSGLLQVASAGLLDISTLLSGEELTAANSASFKNAVKRERSRTDVNVNLNDPSGAVDSVQSETTGQVSGLNVGVNMAN